MGGESQPKLAAPQAEEPARLARAEQSEPDQVKESGAPSSAIRSESVRDDNPPGIGADRPKQIDMAAAGTTPAEPSAPDIDELLGLAQARLEAYKLTTPAHDSALHYYSRVLELDPQNPQARAGLSE